MQTWNTPTGRWRAVLVATIMLGVLLFVVAATKATGAKQPQPRHLAGTAPLTPRRAAPAAPAGPRGPITLTCHPGDAGVIGAASPAGPQGPVGVNCAATPNG